MWKWLEPQLLNAKCDACSGIVSNSELVAIADKTGSNVFLSADAGDNWDGPFPTGVEHATLSLVGKQFWLVERNSACASKDGMAWRDLPQGMPFGKIVASFGSTHISIERRRFNMLRSGDGSETWNET